MAMRRIVQAVGRTAFRPTYAARTLPSHQQGPIPQESKVGKSTPHAERDTYAPPQHRGTPDETHKMSWEKIKEDISQGRPGGQQSQQPWMEKAKETLTQATDYIKEKTSNLSTEDLSKTAENLKEGAKDKMNQAADFIKEKTDTTGKDFTETAKEKFEDIKEGAKDKLAQAQEFVRKQTISDSSKKVKDAAKEKYEDLKYTAEQKKKITEEAWDFSKLKKDDTTTSKTPNADFYGKESTAKDTFYDTHVAGEQTISSVTSTGKGILDSVKETASSAAEWVKDKLTPSGSEKQNLNAATDEKVQASADKLKSDLKANEDEILKESISMKDAVNKRVDKKFTDEKVDKNY